MVLWTFPFVGRHKDVFIYVQATSQVRVKRLTQRRLGERRQDVSVVCLHNVLLERCFDVSRGRLNDVPSVRLY